MASESRSSLLVLKLRTLSAKLWRKVIAARQRPFRCRSWVGVLRLLLMIARPRGRGSGYIGLGSGCVGEGNFDVALDNATVGELQDFVDVIINQAVVGSQEDADAFLAHNSL